MTSPARLRPAMAHKASIHPRFGIVEERRCRMAYADQKMGSGKIGAIIIVALIHALLGYAFVTGLAFKYVKAVTKDLNAFDVEEPPPPPPDEPPPPPPDQPMQPPPVVSPPPMVTVPSPPPQIVTVATPPPFVAAVPVAAAPVVVAKPVSQAAKLSTGDIQRLFGDPTNYPDSARDANAQGTVRAALQIDGSGRVVNCTVAASSGNAALDAQTCRLFRRIKASPAKDDAGNGVASSTTLKFTWKLPEE